MEKSGMTQLLKLILVLLEEKIALETSQFSSAH
jgi:hypothetical protein